MTDAAELLAAYDAQLRGEPEALGAARRERLGPLWVSVFAGGRGFISYRDLGGLDQAGIRALVAESLALVSGDPEVTEVEWKTRAHDVAPGLHDALTSAGFVPQEPESIMIGAAALLAVGLPVPEGVVLRTVTEEAEVRRASAFADGMFGEPPQEYRVAGLLERIRHGAEAWVAEAGGEIVCCGRLDPVPGTDFAGIWGGATRPDWRRRGVYRALTAERAKSAVRQGVRFINSDSTEYSRPILERSGFTRVSTTTPYEWHR